MTWSTTENTQSIIVDQTGIVTVEVANANGCSAMTDISITEHPNPTVEITGPSSICANSMGTLSVPSGFANYLWSTGETTSSIDVTAAGTYSIVVTDNNDCTATDNFDISVTDNIEFDIVGDTSICEGTTTTLSGPPGMAMYNWNPAGSTQSISVGTTGNYSLTVTDATGCTGVNQVVVTVNDNM